MSEGVKVLVVDDETAILESLKILLKREGYAVSTAATGKEALERDRTARRDKLMPSNRSKQFQV